MDAYETVMAGLDRQIGNLKVEGLVQTAALLEGMKAAIANGGTDVLGMIGLIAGTVENLERRIVEIESREI
ncbi:MAG: hypothetical protein P0Y60_14550 [Candidatus Microbacterium colombiense]|nr:MAG: hypothetical protein P0Y60_14550 [Microbacterium sp.]